MYTKWLNEYRQKEQVIDLGSIDRQGLADPGRLFLFA